MRGRRLRSFYVVYATLVLTPTLLVVAHATLLPWAVQRGWFTARAERELSALVGSPVRIGSMRLEDSRRLALRDVRIAALSAAVGEMSAERIVVELDGFFPWGAPTALELVRPRVTISPEQWERGEGGDVALSSELCGKLRGLPAVRVVGADVEIRMEFDRERLQGLDGRLAIEGDTLKLAFKGRAGDGPPGSFALDGDVDLRSGKPSISARTIQPALPTALRRVLASLLSIQLEELRVRQELTLDEGTARRMELSMEPRGMQAVIRSRGEKIPAFGLRMSMVETALELSGAIPGVQIPLGNGGVAEIDAAFSLYRREGGRYEGVARLRAGFYLKPDDEEPVETADLLMEDLTIDAVPASVSFRGNVSFTDGRTIELVGVQASETELRAIGALKGWSLKEQPWTLVPMEAPPVEGTIDAEFDATWKDGAIDAKLAVRTPQLVVQESLTLATEGPVTARIRGKAWEARARFKDVTMAARPDLRPLTVDVDFTGTRDGTSFLGALTAACEGTELKLEASVDAAAPSVRGHGRLSATDGPTIDLSAFEFARRGSQWIAHLEGAAKRWDLSKPWPLAWQALAAERPDLRGTIDLSGNVWRRGDELDVDVSIESAGWTATYGAATLKLGSARAKWTPILAGMARKLDVDVPRGLTIAVAMEEPLDVETGAIRIEGQWTQATADAPYIFKDLAVTIAGAKALRGSAFFDGGADAIAMTLSGAYDRKSGHLTLLESSATIGGRGRVTASGEVDETFTSFKPRLRIAASDCEVAAALELASLGVDVSNLTARGTAGGEWAIEPDGGIGIVRVKLPEVAFKNFKWTGVEAEIPFVHGKAGSAMGKLSYVDFEYPGGRAGGTGAGFVLRRDGSGRYEAQLDGKIEGQFCGGKVALEALLLRGGAAPLAGEATIAASGVDVAAFSRLAGLSKPIPGVLTGRFERTRFTMDEIVFAGEGLRGEAFEGAWGLHEVRIGDPFGGMTTYSLTAEFDRLNLRHVLTYWTDYGLVHGTVAGVLTLEVFKNGEPTGFELELHDVRGADAERILSKRAVAALIRAFDPSAEGETMARRLEGLAIVPEYDRFSLYARLDRDQRVSVRGRHYLDPVEGAWGTYTLTDLRSDVVKPGMVEYLMVGSGRHGIDVIQRTPRARPRFDSLLRRLKDAPVTGE